MGKILNIGKADFEQVRRFEYVDKSMLIAYVNGVLDSQNRYMCVIERMGNAGKSWALLAYARGEDSQSKPLKFTKYSQSIHKVIRTKIRV